MQFDVVPLQLPAERFRVATDMCRKARLSGVVAVGCGNITVGMKMRGQFFERKCYFGAANVFTLWERNRAYRCPPTHRCPHKRFQLTAGSGVRRCPMPRHLSRDALVPQVAAFAHCHQHSEHAYCHPFTFHCKREGCVFIAIKRQCSLSPQLRTGSELCLYPSVGSKTLAPERRKGMVSDPVVAHLSVGIDIAAATFTAAWSHTDTPVSPAHIYTQTPHGFAALQTQLAATTVAPVNTLVVMEATGSPWIALAVALHTAGYPVSVINPLWGTPLRQSTIAPCKDRCP